VAVSAQRRRRVLVAVVAALIAAGAFYLAIEYTNKTPATSSGTAATATAPPGTTATVVVASANIPAGTLLTASNLKTEAVSTQVLTVLTTAGGADYPTIAALTASKEYAASALVAGLPVLSAEVTATPTSANPVVSGIPAALPAGYVAISLPYSPASSSGTGEGTGGYIQALDRIDILVNEAAGGPVYWAYENVLVLAVGQATTGPVVSASASPAASASASSAPTVTGALIMVELPRQDAAALANVEDTSGAVIQYAIVSSGDYPSPSASPQPAITAPATTVTSPIQFFAG
jgi:Flp pilus assembly protein CpaB